MKLKLLFLLFFASFSSYSQGSIVPTNGLLAYYPFTGNANDSSGNGNNGVATDVTLTTDRLGNANSAYSLNGTSSYIDAFIASIPQNNVPRTISGWFKSDSPNFTDSYSTIFDYGSLTTAQRFSLSLYSKGYLDFMAGPIFSNDDAFGLQNNHFNNVWYLFTLTYDGTKVSLFVNGNYVNFKNIALNTINKTFRIGKRIFGDTENDYFKGAIDDIGIWNRVLTTDEIKGLYNYEGDNVYTLIPDLNFEKNLILQGIDSGTTDGKVLTSNISYLTFLDVSYSQIADLTGIQDFVGLKNLNCYNNLLTNIDVTKNIALNDLNCGLNQLSSLDISKNTALKYLNCTNMQKLTSLDVSKNVDLLTLNCHNNQLTALDISQNLKLLNVNCSSNKLTILDVSKNIALTTLRCYSNQLTTLDVYKNVFLTNFSCNLNQLLSLDISKNVALKILFCDTNKLTGLDVSNNIALTQLNCNSNQLNSLDISKNVALTSLRCDSNQLNILNLKNGKNTLSTNISFSNFKNNPNLSCIQVNDVAYSNANWSTLKDAIASYSTSCSLEQYTLIPDLNFEKKLIALGIDSGATDGKVLTSNISFLTSLDVSSSSISNFTGIQDFVALTSLNCSNNQLKILDVSKNIALTSLDCFYNQITSLDLSQNIVLTNLICTYNRLTTLDVSLNISLTSLACDSNQLKSLDISNNIALNSLDCSNNIDLTTLDISKNNNTSLLTLNCYNNKLTALDVSKNTALTSLNCSSSQLTTLDISKNTALTNLVCTGNQLSKINLFNNVALDTLRCNSNKLVTLDISKNVNLKKLYCYNNKLKSLNLKNGNNIIFENNNNSYNLSYKNNPNLTCIQVDDKTYSDTNWSDFKDVTANYSENCPPAYIVVSSEFEDKLIALGIDKDGKNGSTLLSSIINVTSIDVSNSSITNLSGIEYFTDLETLICKGNSLTTINLSENIVLKYLDCSNNPLTTLDVSKNILLQELYCDGVVTIINKSIAGKTTTTAHLTVLDLSNNLFLNKLSCSNNQIISLDISNNSLLTDVNCSNNSLQNLNINNGNNTNMVNVNFKNNFSLLCIKVDNDVYSYTNWVEAKDTTTTYSKTDCTLGVGDFTFDKTVLYPNPVLDELYISNIILQKASVYNILGKLVKTTCFNTNSNNNIMDLCNLKKGVYFIYLESDLKNVARKIIVE